MMAVIVLLGGWFFLLQLSYGTEIAHLMLSDNLCIEQPIALYFCIALHGIAT